MKEVRTAPPKRPKDARRHAIDALLDQKIFVLNPGRFDAFANALDNPPALGPKLRALLRRVPAWRANP